MHNEGENVNIMFDRLNKVIKDNKINSEVILIDDNSKDNTGEICDKIKNKNKNVKVIHRKGANGLGGVFRDGFREASGDLIISLDGDLSHEPETIPIFLKKYDETKADLIIGSRFINGGSVELPALRVFLSRSCANIARIITGIPVEDCSSGYRLHTREVVKNLNLKSNGFEVHTEIPVKTYLMGYRVDQVPINYKKRVYGSSKLKFLTMWTKYFKVIVREKFNKILKKNEYGSKRQSQG